MERAEFFTHEFDVRIMKQNTGWEMRKYPIIIEQKKKEENHSSKSVWTIKWELLNRKFLLVYNVNPPN